MDQPTGGAERLPRYASGNRAAEHPHPGEEQVMEIHDPASQAMQKNYDVTDIERLMGKRDRKNYDDVIK